MKKFLTVLLALFCAFSFTACGEKEPAERVTITFWSNYSDHQKEVATEIIDAFNASQDKYTVVMEAVDKEYLNQIPQAVAAKEGPDFVIEYGSYAANYHVDDLVVNLDDYISDAMKENLIDSANEYAHGFDDGGMYIYPVIGTGEVLWYNPDIFELAGVEVPTTWDEVFEVAKIISEKVTCVNDETGIHFVTDGSGSKVYGWIPEGDETLREICMQAGTGYYDLETGEVKFNNATVKAFLEKYQQACNEGYVTSTFTYGYGNGDMSAGTLAMCTGSVASGPYFQLSHDSAPIPQLGGEGTVKSTCARSRGVMVFDNGDEDRIKGAVAFLEFFTSAENNAKFVEAMNYYAVLKDTLANEDYQEFEATTKAFTDVEAEYGSYYESVAINTYVQQALKNVIAQVGSGTDVQTALDDAEAFVNANK